jgi:hypothetical protein
MNQRIVDVSEFHERYLNELFKRIRSDIFERYYRIQRQQKEAYQACTKDIAAITRSKHSDKRK